MTTSNKLAGVTIRRLEERDLPAADKILRQAFGATLRDKAFLAEVEKLQIAVDPMSADEVGAIVAETINAAPDVVAQAKAAMEAPDTRPPSGAAPQP